MSAPSAIGSQRDAAPARPADAARLAAPRLRAGFEHALSRRDDEPAAVAMALPQGLPATPLPAPSIIQVTAATRPAPAAPVDGKQALPDASTMPASAPATPGQWRIELRQANLPVQALDLQRDAGGHWQVLLHTTTGAGARLQRLRERLAAFGATLQTILPPRNTLRDTLRDTPRDTPR